MGSIFHNIVRLFAIKNEQSNRTWAISGTVSKADEGKALTQDLTQPNTLKLAGDGDPVIARLEVYETRGVCTAQHHFTEKMPKSGSIAVGDTVVGAGSGLVKSAGAGGKNPALNYVAEVGTDFVVVIRM